MCLKRQYINFDQSYLTIPILHFQKSSMLAILRQYEHLGVNHLAKLCGYILKNQWIYIKNLFSINKLLEFLEKLCDSLHLAASYESESKLIDFKTVFEWTKESLGKVLPVLKDFIEKCCTDDKVFQKNIDLLKVIKTILLHYTEERSQNWHVHTAALKELIYIAMISNYTQYGPILIEFLFHQFSFQERYLDLTGEGFFI